MPTLTDGAGNGALGSWLSTAKTVTRCASLSSPQANCIEFQVTSRRSSTTEVILPWTPMSRSI